MCALSKFVICHWVWERLWHGRRVYKRGAGQKAAPQQYIFLPPVSLLPCDTVRWRRKPGVKWGASMSTLWIPVLLWNFLKINAHFLSAFTMYVIRLTETLFFFPFLLVSFSRSRRLFFFFFPPPGPSTVVTFWVSLQKEVSSFLLKAQRGRGQRLARLHFFFPFFSKVKFHNCSNSKIHWAPHYTPMWH